MATTKDTRKGRMHSRWRHGGYRESDPAGKNVPWLNVSGDWLRQAGFKIGDRIRITVKQCQLVIETENPAAHGD